MGFGRKRKIVVKKKAEKRIEQDRVIINPPAKKKIDRESRKESNGFTIIFECWNCKNRIKNHYSRLESINSNTVGDCDKCGKKNAFEVVRRINDR